jgi:hypothetical protein
LLDILLFGTGSGCDNFEEIIDHSKVNILAYIDNNQQKQGSLCHGKIIIPPSGIKDYKYDYIVIVSMYVLSITKQMLDLGIEDMKILSIYDDGDLDGIGNGENFYRFIGFFRDAVKIQQEESKLIFSEVNNIFKEVKAKDFLQTNILLTTLKILNLKYAKVLDIECSGGIYLESFKELNIVEYFGIDRSERFINNALTLFPNKRVTFKNGDLLSVSEIFGPNFFDLAFVWDNLDDFNYLELIIDLERVVRRYLIIEGSITRGNNKENEQLRIFGDLVDNNLDSINDFLNLYGLSVVEMVLINVSISFYMIVTEKI